MSPPKHTLFTFHTKVRSTVRLSFLATRYSSSHYTLLSKKKTKLYENLTYGPHAARVYRIKLQR